MHIHLLGTQLSSGNPLVYPLMGGIKTPSMAHHTNEPVILFQIIYEQGAFPIICQRELNLHIHTGFHALRCLVRRHVNCGAQNVGLNTRKRLRLSQARCRVTNIRHMGLHIVVMPMYQ